MASAMAFLRAMAGHAPAIRIYAVAAICLSTASLIVASLPARAEMDQRTRGKMQYVHRSLLIAEENRGISVRDTDIPRAKLVNALLFHPSSGVHEQKLPANSCLEAMSGLGNGAVAAAFSVHPIATGDLGSMSPDDLRFSEQMRPTADTVQTLFIEHALIYRTKMVDCEQRIGFTATPRSLPDKLPQK